MKKSELLAKVKEEATTLRNVLTAEQKAKMNHSTLNPHLSNQCLFGQIFGSFRAPEARAVLPKSIYSSVPDITMAEGFSFENNPNIRLDFNRFKLTEDNPQRFMYNHFTHIEVYLMCETNSEEMFKYIKGEVETFEPSFLEVEVEA